MRERFVGPAMVPTSLTKEAGEEEMWSVTPDCLVSSAVTQRLYSIFRYLFEFSLCVVLI